MSSTTPNLGLYLPNPGDGTSNGQPWGPQVNANFTKIDGIASTTDSAKGAALVGAKQPFEGATGTTQNEFNSRSVSIFDFLSQSDRDLISAGTGADSTVTSDAINAAISHLKQTGGGEILFPIGKYKLKTTISLPKSNNASTCSIKLKGSGAYSETAGTRFVWAGDANSTIVDVGDYSQIEDIFISGGGITGLVGLNMKGSSSTYYCSNITMKRVIVQSCGVGFDFDYTWDNSFWQCLALYCVTGFRFNTNGDNNSISFLGCHSIRCDTGVSNRGYSRNISWEGCSFENTTGCAVDLSSGGIGYPQDWGFRTSYFEGNAQTFIIEAGIVNIDGARILSDGTTLGAFTLSGGITRVSIKNVWFDNVTSGKEFIFGASISSAEPGAISISGISPNNALAKCLQANLDPINSGKIDLQGSGLSFFETPYITAATYTKPFCQLGDVGPMIGTKIVAAWIIVNNTVSGTNFTVAMGTNSTSYNNILGSNLGSSVSALRTQLALVNSNVVVSPDAYGYQFNNSGLSGGEYKIQILLSR